MEGWPLGDGVPSRKPTLPRETRRGAVWRGKIGKKRSLKSVRESVDDILFHTRLFSDQRKSLFRSICKRGFPWSESHFDLSQVHLGEASGLGELLGEDFLINRLAQSQMMLVAIKTLRRNADDQARANFHKEVKIMCGLKVRVYCIRNLLKFKVFTW